MAGRNQKQGQQQSGRADGQEDQQEEQGLTSRVGPVEINWPQTIGYYGGVGLALAAELIEPPIALFIAAIPLFKMLSHPSLPRQVRFVSQVLEGTAKPVGGSDEATIHLTEQRPTPGWRSSIWHEARHIAAEKRPPAHRSAASPRRTCRCRPNSSHRRLAWIDPLRLVAGRCRRTHRMDPFAP